MKQLSISKRILAMVILCISVFTTTSCSSADFDKVLNALESAADELENNACSPYTVAFKFDDINDEQTIKQRLVAINCTVENSTKESEYIVTSPYVLNEDWFSIICSNQETVLVDESEQIFLDKENVINCKLDGVSSILFEITAEFFDKHYETYISGNYYLKSKNKKSPVYISMELKDGKYTVLIVAENHTSGASLSDDEKAIIASTVYYSSAQLNNTVTSSIIQKP